MQLREAQGARELEKDTGGHGEGKGRERRRKEMKRKGRVKM